MLLDKSLGQDESIKLSKLISRNQSHESSVRPSRRPSRQTLRTRLLSASRRHSDSRPRPTLLEPSPRLGVLAKSPKPISHSKSHESSARFSPSPSRQISPRR